MIKILLTVLIGFTGSVGFAQTNPLTVKSLEWSANGRFSAVISDGGPDLKITGELAENGNVTVTQDGFTLRLKAYSDVPFVSIIVSYAGEAEGYLTVFERQNTDFAVVNSTPIVGRAPTMPEALQYSLTNLAGQPTEWNSARVFRSIDQFVRDNPGKTLEDYASLVERNDSSLLPIAKPVPQVDPARTRVARENQDDPFSDGQSAQAGDQPRFDQQDGDWGDDYQPAPQPRRKKNRRQPVEEDPFFGDGGPQTGTGYLY